MESYDVIRNAVSRVGAKKVAAAMRVSVSLVYKWCEAPGVGVADEASGARNPLDRVRQLAECTGELAPIDWLCQRAHGTFVPDPEAGRADIDAEYIAHTQRMIQNFSDLLGVVSASIADDGRVDPGEAEEIRRQWQELKQYGEAFVLACERGLFDGRPKRRGTH